jgi:hypothetical protein
MRWRFAETNEEAAAKERALQTMASFWAAFEESCDTLAGENSGTTNEIAEWMTVHLGNLEIAEWEFGPALEGDGHRLSLGTLNERHSIPMLRAFVALAPPVHGWEFYAGRARWPESWVAQQEAHPRGWQLSVKRWRAELIPNDGKINLRMYSPEIGHLKEVEEHGGDACLALEMALGEEMFDTWVGEVEVLSGTAKPWPWSRARPTEEYERAIPIAKLHQALEMELQRLRSALPSETRVAGGASELPTDNDEGSEQRAGYVYRLDAEDASVNAPRFSDAFVASTLEPALFEAVRASVFCSKNFSRLGETFCYLKLARPDINDTDLAPRNRLTDALEDRLITADLGCSYGAACGVHYWYIDLALVSVEDSIPIIRSVLQERAVPRDSWLLFYDSELNHEWIGIYPDTLEPDV